MVRITGKFEGVRERSRSLSVLLAVFGIVLLVFFLRNVDNGASTMLLFAGAILLSLGNILAFLTVDDYTSNVHFFFVLYITTFFLFVMHDLRFGILQGSDITLEYTSSKITATDGAWLLSRANQGERYFSSASVSLVPAIISKITGLDLMPMFQWVMRLVIAVLPVIIFLTVKDIFRNVKLAALSALVFSQLHFNFNLLNYAIRQGIAEMFLVLTIFLLVRLQQTKSNSLAYAVSLSMSMFGLVITHYTLNYWSVIIFVSIFFLCYMVGVLPRRLLSWIRMTNLKMEKPIVNDFYLIYFIAATLIWIYFTNLTPFLIDIRNELYLLSPRGAIESPVSQTSWILENPAGPIVGVWFDLTALLIPIGVLYALFRMRKQARHMPWLVGCLVMLAIMAVWTVAGSRMLGLFLDRIFTIGAPFFTTFIAISLLLLDKKLKNKKFVVSVFLLLNLPINMLIPAHQRYALYHSEESIDPEVAVIQRYIRVPEYTASVWMDQHTNENLTFYTDFVETWFYSRYHVSIAGSEEPPTNSTDTYFVLHYYNLKHGKWQEIFQGSTLAQVVDFPVNSFLNNCSVIYNNGDAAIISRIETES